MSDQNDPRLGTLFAHLAAATTVAEARTVEGQIWEIWFQGGDPKLDRQMTIGSAAIDACDGAAAMAAFGAVIAARPDFAEGWNRRATLFFLMQRFPESVADIEKTLELEPRHFGALSGRGLVYLQLEEEALALNSFEGALEIHPRLRGAEYNAKMLRRQMENNEI